MKDATSDAPGRELHDHEGRTGAAGYAWQAVLVELVFAAAGGFPLTLALDPLREPGVSPDVAATLVGGFFGLVFVTTGL